LTYTITAAAHDEPVTRLQAARLLNVVDSAPGIRVYYDDRRYIQLSARHTAYGSVQPPEAAMPSRTRTAAGLRSWAGLAAFLAGLLDLADELYAEQQGLRAEILRKYAPPQPSAPLGPIGPAEVGDHFPGLAGHAQAAATVYSAGTDQGRPVVTCTTPDGVTGTMMFARSPEGAATIAAALNENHATAAHSEA
jgi:hypothetical protein